MWAYFLLFYLGAVSESDMSGYSDMGETDTGLIRPIAHEDISPFYLDKILQCMGHMGSGGLGSVMFTAGLNDLKGLLQPK